MDMLAGHDASANHCRKPEIMADAAYAILIQDPKVATGNFFIDDEVLQKAGVTDMDQYACNLEYKDKLMPDFFVDDKLLDYTPSADRPKIGQAVKEQSSDLKPSGKLGEMFTLIERNLNEDLVSQIQAVYTLNLTGADSGKWYVKYITVIIVLVSLHSV